MILETAVRENRISEVMVCMSKFDILKEQYIKEQSYSISYGCMKCINSNTRHDFRYVANGGVTKVIYNNEISCFEDLLKWKGIKIKNTDAHEFYYQVTCINNCTLGKAYLDNILDNIQRISGLYGDIEFLVGFYKLRVNLLLGRGILEKRSWDHIIVNAFDRKSHDEIFSEVFLGEDPELGNIEKSIEKYKKNCKYTPKAVTGKNIVLFKPRAAAALIHELIGHSSEQDIYEDINKNELQVGEKIFKFDIDIIDISNSPEVITNVIYDDLGYAEYDLPLVEKGILKRVLSYEDRDVYDDNFLKGHIIFSLNDCIPQVRMKTLTVKGKFIDELADKGLIVIEKFKNCYREGADVIFEIMEGYVRNEEYFEPIKNSTIRIDIRKMLKCIEGLYGNHEVCSMMNCRKNNGRVLLSSITPGIVCNMDI